ncbi:hypothetical protein LTR74_010266 [Friedmanniomyces endolithicus]|nr:hypothetical protein LTR74_010266 [Friedmanniomyces endolithicus]
MTETRHVLRIRRTDSDREHILVQVIPSGNKALDLKLVASENEHVYPATITESKVKALQASNYSGDLDEWKTILRYILLRHQPASPLPDALQGLEMVAALSTAVSLSDGLRDQLDTLQASAELQREQVARLNRQLDELVKAKKEHEDELLQKFAALLNAKKLKIRDQQRLLAGAKVDPKIAAAVSGSRNGTGDHREAGDSRNAKRKAERASAEPDGASEDEVITEGGSIGHDDLMREQETPLQTEDDATEGDDDDDETGFDAAPSSPRTVGRGVNSKNKEIEATSHGPTSKHSDAGSPPPRRELPFAREGAHVDVEAKRPEPKVVPVVASGDDDDDDETDDEL